MIKTTTIFSAHTLHALHVLVRDFFIFMVVLLAALFFWLIHGISIEKLTFGHYEVDGLYIKLDKKLTLHAKRVIIPTNKAKPSFENVDKTFDHIKDLLTYFDSIYLEKIDFNNNQLTIFYTDDVLYITSNDYEVAGNIVRKGKKLVADVSMLRVKGYNLTVSGDISYDLSSHEVESSGAFSLYGIRGHFRVVKHGDNIIYALNTKRFSDLAPLIKRIHLPPLIQSWIIEKVKAKSYKIEYLKGRFSLSDRDIVRTLSAMKAKAHFRDVDIRYKNKVDPVHAKEMFLVFKKGNLYFDLVDPRQNGRSAAGTTVRILHLVGRQKPVLILDLHVVSPLDEDVQKILRAYKLDIPILHTGMKNRVVVTLKIPLGNDDRKMKTKVDVASDEGELTLKEMKFHVQEGHIVYENGKAAVKHVSIDEPWYKGIVDGTVDVRHKEASFILDTEKFMLGKPSDPFLLMERTKVPMMLSYTMPVTITFPTLAVTIQRSKEMLTIHLGDLSKVMPYVGKNILGIKGGDVVVTTRDRKYYHVKGVIKKDDCIFYDKAHVCYTRIPIDGTYDVDSGDIDIYAFEKRFHYNSKKSEVFLRGLNIDLKRFLEEKNKRTEFHTKLDETRNLISKKLLIIGQNSQLRYNQYRLVTDGYDIEVDPDGNIKAIGSKDGDVVKFTKKGNIMTIKALRIKDAMLHPLIHFTGLKKGRYSLKKKGDPSKRMKGQILIEGGILSNFKAYSNTLAFINALPALATLNDPGFSKQGFKIKEGVINYTMTPEKIVFDSVYLKGNSATIVGKGTIDLKTKQLQINLAIQTVRELGKMVGKIPLLGYILMGNDNSMTVGLKITGSMENPKVNTSMAKDILTLPLQILKRTMTVPAHMGTFEQTAPNIPNFNEKESKEQPGEEAKKRKSSPLESSKPIRSAEPSKDQSGQLF